MTVLFSIISYTSYEHNSYIYVFILTFEFLPFSPSAFIDYIYFYFLVTIIISHTTHTTLHSYKNDNFYHKNDFFYECRVVCVCVCV